MKKSLKIDYSGISQKTHLPFRPKPHEQKNPDAKSTGKKQLQGEDNNLGYEIHKNQQTP